MYKKLSADVAVIGGGVTGLFLTKMLADRSEGNVRVALIQNEPELAKGPSTRNEGWLHSGAYHAAAILDRRIAVQVARRVKFGYEHVKSFAPEALEEKEAETFALVDEDLCEEVTSRWDEAEVTYEKVSKKKFSHLAPQVNIDEVTNIFKVPDVSINVRVLYQQLASSALQWGSTFLTHTTIESMQDDRTLRLSRSGETFFLECPLYVYAAGYGIKDLFKSLFDIDLPVRCWVSHLLDLPRVLTPGVFCLKPGQPTVMHHGPWSIVGTNADQISVSEPPEDQKADDEIVDHIKFNLSRLIRDVTFEDAHGRCCVKVDMDPGKQAVSDALGFAPPQLNFSCGEPQRNHIWVLPGKMTEAPYLADFLTSYFFQQHRLGNLISAAGDSNSMSADDARPSPGVAPRPIDSYEVVSHAPPPETDGEDFDVFLSHNSKDKQTVRKLAEELRGRKLKVWLDESELIPGRPWQEAIERIILSTKCAAVLVGKDGLGPWEEPEMRACLNQFVKRKMPVIPVLLPGSSETPILPPFLQEFTWVDLRRDYQGGLRRLIWGITGQRDLEQPPPPVAAPHRFVEAAKMASTHEHLIGRTAELERLDRAWNSPDGARIHIISIAAWGGVGKSALVNHWFGQMASRDFDGANVLYWSFYSLGGSDEKAASVEEFVEKALDKFGDGAPAKGSSWDRTQRLVDHLRSARTLLILDGLEPLQHPPGPMAGRLKDHSMQFLVRELAAANPGLCVITTRFALPEIDSLVATTAPRIELKGLSADDGAELLEKFGVNGSKKDLRQASIEFKGHALTLTLLATFLRDRCNGDIHRRHEVELLDGDEELGRHAKSVMASYVKGFGEEPEIAVLKLVGLFDRRVGAAAIDVFREGPIIDGLTNALFRYDSGALIPMDKSSWLHVLQRLRKAHLLLAADPNVPEALDAHPLVREYFRAYLKEKFPGGWKSGNARLYEHFKHASPKLPASRTEMESLYSAMIHACRAGLHEEALEEIYRQRIHQGSEGHSHRILGSYEAELAMLSEFFELNSNWGHPLRQLKDGTQATVLGLAGSRLRALGRLAEAVDPLRRSLQVHEHLGDYLLAAVRARHLSEVHMTLGNLEQALEYAHEELRLTEESEKLMSSDLRDQATTATEDENNIVYEKVVQLTIRGTILHQQGNWPEAQKLFVTAEKMQQNAWPKLPVLFSLWGFRYCDLLLDQLEYAPKKEFRQQFQKLQERLAAMQDLPADVLANTVPERNLALVGKGLEDLFLAKLTLIRARKSHAKNSIETQAEVRQAIDNLRIASRPEYIPLGLLARATLHCEMGDLKTAERELKDALEIVKSGKMQLYEVDCYLYFIRLHLQQFRHSSEEHYLKKARKYWDDAYSEIERLGYYRRNQELDSLKALFPSK